MPTSFPLIILLSPLPPKSLLCCVFFYIFRVLLCRGPDLVLVTQKKTYWKTNQHLHLEQSTCSFNCLEKWQPCQYNSLSVTVSIIFLVIFSLYCRPTVNSFYLPSLIVVFGHMCLLVGPLFCKTKTEATPKEKEYEKVCERLFHLHNCWLWKKCPVSYSVLIDVVKSCICIWHQVVCIEDCRLPGWGEKEDQ